MFRIGTKTKVVLGAVGFYASAEAYLHWSTQQIINSRKISISSQEKFKSETVAGMFINPFPEYRPQTGFEFMLVRFIELFESFYGNKIELHEHPDKDHTVEDYLQIHKPNIDIFTQNSKILQECIKNDNFKAIKSSWWSSPINKQLLCIWLGQSCSLIQISGINFLTDPILSDHLFSPHIGPRRLNSSPMDLKDLQNATNNQLNFIIVSHDHPDHLEMDLVKQIGNKSTWIVPLGLKKTLARKGIYNIIEMDWWESIKLNPYIKGGDKLDDYEIVCLPSMHWSGRWIVDANFSLWCSFIIKQNGKSIVYHAGDTGYLKELFEEIGRVHAPVHLSLLPIGQYCPSWHQKPRHISPEESLKIVDHLKSSFMFGVHWGTYKLSSEPILEPKKLLTKLSKDREKTEYFKTPEFGLTYLFDIDKNIQYPIY